MAVMPSGPPVKAVHSISTEKTMIPNAMVTIAKVWALDAEGGVRDGRAHQRGHQHAEGETGPEVEPARLEQRDAVQRFPDHGRGVGAEGEEGGVAEGHLAEVADEEVQPHRPRWRRSPTSVARKR